MVPALILWRQKRNQILADKQYHNKKLYPGNKTSSANWQSSNQLNLRLSKQTKTKFLYVPSQEKTKFSLLQGFMKISIKLFDRG